MAEFFLVFVVTFLVVGGVALAMAFGKKPVYQPEIEDLQATLTRLLEGQLTPNEWNFFIDMPIRHNEELDNIRLQCQSINELYALRVRNNQIRFREEGEIKLRFILSKLEQAGSRSF
ncbi:hypothetical protein QWZ13_06340 [Reinekea marina]|uniref:Uncharacterized protein n=1 Tax=Reinekea marina TaxID=1310421 RepID=A0ABV7WMV4_9GAMM|nr:hypothetical protein [Reinekea marina]MDN3648527.1 hypothetical protein [Reinekea marina]